jgi:lysozyme
MIITNDCKKIIKHFESLKLKSYKCPAGVWTIGWGNTDAVEAGMLISESIAEELLDKDIESTINSVNHLVKVDLRQNQFDALVSLVFNLGHGNFSKSTLLKLLNERDYLGAANEFAKWRMAGGEVMHGLVRRRLAEANLFIGAPYDHILS